MMAGYVACRRSVVLLHNGFWCWIASSMQQPGACARMERARVMARNGFGGRDILSRWSESVSQGERKLMQGEVVSRY